jgi:nicotinamidase-related amidase
VEHILHSRTLDPGMSCLIVVDIQDKFRPAIMNFDVIAGGISRLVLGCRLLKVPVLATEQYPKGLGATVEQVKSVLPEGCVSEKTSFSCIRDDGFTDRLKATGAKQVIVCGVEAHVCVNQTVHDFLALGFAVHVPVDLVGSRKTIDYETALKKMEKSGAVLSTLEMVLFEMLGGAGNPKFREIQKLVK